MPDCDFYWLEFESSWTFENHYEDLTNWEVYCESDEGEDSFCEYELEFNCYNTEFEVIVMIMTDIECLVDENWDETECEKETHAYFYAERNKIRETFYRNDDHPGWKIIDGLRDCWEIPEPV